MSTNDQSIPQVSHTFPALAHTLGEICATPQPDVFYVLGASTDSPRPYHEGVSRAADMLEDASATIADRYGLDHRLVLLAIVETTLQRQ